MSDNGAKPVADSGSSTAADQKTDKDHTAVYTSSEQDAKERGEEAAFFTSIHSNELCAAEISNAIRNCYLRQRNALLAALCSMPPKNQAYCCAECRKDGERAMTRKRVALHRRRRRAAGQ
jgi:hypothetical protein